jgi:serine/threonine protein kinase
MNSIAKTLKGLHAVGIMMLLLSCENIYLKDSKDIFLGDWSLVCLDGSSKIEHKFIFYRSEGLAPEILTEGTCSFSSDIYSLGKIFEKIYRIGSLESTETTEGRLLEIISQMTNS